MRRLLSVIIAVALIGLGISVYSYLHNQYVVTGTFCNLNETVNCDLVNRSAYAKFFGIPVAGLGFIGYLFLLAGALVKWRAPADRFASWFLIATSAAGFLFSLYLTGVEAFVLRAWCVLCITSQILITLSLLASLWLLKFPSTEPPKASPDPATL
ncbi:vitamin K epoxide reductase family protein [Candidatus Uhrbacteria bacterium]|nr:vitamin K epoxide reductase family protein [Candidatus Uhrbacteria bacterium]